MSQEVKVISATSGVGVQVDDVGGRGVPVYGDLMQYLTNIGRGYAFLNFVSIASAFPVETPWLYFKNDGTLLVRLYEQIASIPDSASTLRSTLKIYKNPTGTVSGGAAIGIGGLRNGQAPTTCTSLAYVSAVTPLVVSGTAPASYGVPVQDYGVINTPTQRLLNLTRFIEPGDSILVTVSPSAATTIHSFSQSWVEVPNTAIEP